MSSFYKYYARDEKRKSREGMIEALDETDAAKKLQEQGLVVISVEQLSATKKCPYCAEEIKYEAIKCKYCGESLSIAEQKVEKIYDDKVVSGVKLKCPRCGFEAEPKEFSDAYDSGFKRFSRSKEDLRKRGT